MQDIGVFTRLCIMMLLEFLIFGASFATLGLVLQTHGLAMIIAPAYLLAAIAAIVSPLFLGAIGDRYADSQKVLAVVHLVGGCLLFALPAAIDAGRASAFLILIFVYMLFFMPTLGLVNSISLRHLGMVQKGFPYVRICAPLGWSISGMAIGWLGLSASPQIFTIAGVISIVLAGYSLTLPATPPPARGGRFSFGDLIGRKAFVLFRDSNFTVVIICSAITAICLGFYNTFGSSYLPALGISNVAGVLALGQLSELVFIATIPLFLARLGMKQTLLLGIVMWVVRFGLFMAAARTSLVLAVIGIALHGICNDFCLVIAAMYVSRLAPAHLAAQAQSWVILVYSGIGAAIGSGGAGFIFGSFVIPHMADGPRAWDVMWLVPMVLAVLNAILWRFSFRSEPAAVDQSVPVAHP